MKKKTYTKQGAYQKIDNTKGKQIKGALDFNKEVLDILVDKGLATTENCCNYGLGMTGTTTIFAGNTFVTVNDNRIKANSLVFITVQSQSGNATYSVDPGDYVPGISFTIVRSNNSGNRVVNYLIINP